MRSDPSNLTGLVQFDHHRIGDADTTDPRLADRDPDRSLADKMLPAQSGQGAERGAQDRPARHQLIGAETDEMACSTRTFAPVWWFGRKVGARWAQGERTRQVSVARMHTVT